MTTRIYHTNPAIGREQEIADLELILISPKKSPLLIGDAGVGKTSVVEGLASVSYTHLTLPTTPYV